MGLGIGIGIGWATRGNAPITLGYFNILSDCKGKVFKPNSTFSQQLLSNDYSEGDYVLSSSYGDRVLLGAFVETLPDSYDIITISGQSYNSCEV